MSQNYRPIALLSSFSKIFEKVVYERLYNFLTKYDILTERQHGFCQGLSTETGCADLLQYVSEKIDNKEIVISFSFDLTRAFDTVDKKFVSAKLANMGVRDNMNNFIVSFLSNRNFTLRVNDCKSELFKQDIGTPQGSVLGPLIF